MNGGKICISICAKTAVNAFQKIAAADPMADVIELRLDCLENGAAKLLVDQLPEITGEYLFTFRPHDQGGREEITIAERIRFWSYVFSVCKRKFMIDIEAQPKLMMAVRSDHHRRIVSMHCFDGSPAEIEQSWRVASVLPADIVKIAVTGADAIDAIPVWKLINVARSEGKDIIPIAMGEAGKWTRILGLAHGAFMTYAALEAGGETAPGQTTAREMIDVYRVRQLDEGTEIYGIVAGDTSYSMSPYLHNAAFRSAGLNSVFVPFQVKDLDAFFRRMVRPETSEVELNFRGFSITNPHKQAVIHHLDHLDDDAETIGAVNTVRIIGDKIHGFNTDASGFIQPLKAKLGDLKGSRAAVIGAGGAARACVHSLKSEGADVVVCVRNVQKAMSFESDFGVNVQGIPTGFSGFDIVVNATPVGTRGPYADEAIATAEQLKGVRLVYDLVYNPAETSLLREAGLAGAGTLGGFDMLVAQAAKQFEIWTGQETPLKEMATAAQKKLDEG